MSTSSLQCAACALLIGCGVPKQMFSSPADLADYRAFRHAEREGERLERAQHYLDRHPRGVWADEVRAVFDGEEVTWFEGAKLSRERARDYLADLPRGPHAAVARAILALPIERGNDLDTLVLLAQAQHTAGELDLESAQRRRVGEVILEELSALLDPLTWGAGLDDPPPALERALLGSTRTWMTAIPSLRSDELFFRVRAPTASEERVVPLRLRVTIERRQVVTAQIEGEDLFVRWAEAIRAQPLDPTRAGDRAVAADAVIQVLARAIELRLPARRCAAPSQNDSIMRRVCDGWTLRAQFGSRSGGPDVVYVQGPVLDRASRLGMR
ncbi:MAG: hypothetical protein M3O50_11435 [Myxococcota bacterium]|nr:hypothetical protein [Myxococcota bacterium]